MRKPGGRTCPTSWWTLSRTAQFPTLSEATMRVFENNFSRLHLVVFLLIWACFTGWTYWIAEHGIDQYDHMRLKRNHARSTTGLPAREALRNNSLPSKSPPSGKWPCPPSPDMCRRERSLGLPNDSAKCLPHRQLGTA